MNMEDISIENLETFMKINLAEEAYLKGGIKGLYKTTLKSYKRTKKKAIQREGKEEFYEIGFNSAFLSSKIDMLNLLFGSPEIIESQKHRNIIADELIVIAEEFRKLGE